MGGVDFGEKSDSAPDTARTRRNKTYLLLVLAIQRLLANWLVSGDERQKMTLQPEGYTKTGDFFSALIRCRAFSPRSLEFVELTLGLG